MDFVGKLWLVILLSAAAAWFWAFLSWAALNLHGKDFDKLPDEERFTAALRDMGIPIGRYYFPHMERSECGTPAGKEKMARGPLGLLHVWNPKFSMPRNMILSYLVCVAVSFLMAYVGSLTLAPGAGFAKVMQVMGTIGVLAYAFAFLPNMIWFQGKGRVAALCVMDGVIQGLAVGAVFAAMWPKA
jgi:hypothetical protein